MLCATRINTVRVMIESLGGYRLVRKLGEGPRAEVYLAHPHRVASDAAATAIKIFHSGVSEASISREIEALSRSAGGHTIELIDLTTDPNGAPALILTRCARGTVAKLMATRADTLIGEVITILAPMTEVLGRLHRAGVAHGAIRPDAVLFDAASAPVLGCFGSATLFAPGMSPAARHAEPGIAADLNALRHLAVNILDRVSVGPSAAVREWLKNSDPSDDGWLDALTERLFGMGEASAVDLRREHAQTVPAVPSRLLGVQSGAETTPPRVLAGLAVPEFVARILPAKPSYEGVMATIRDALAVVRLRFWIVGGIVVVSLLAVVATLPREQNEIGEPAPQPMVEVSPRQAATSAVTGDDPAAAAAELLAARTECLNSMSILCLDGVVQPDSSAAAADQLLIRNLQGGMELPPEWHITSDQVAVHERLGDTALVYLVGASAKEPASLLLMKSEAGWRIRDYQSQ